ncbi:Detected protein of unknown function [Hibiscus syriacus]|uniref:Uncharacterized protein n=2 Tax=Hibiscus syriacus TaxID=106335 RepID=A0A6A3CA28_HIBSY|nr:Detected protein of unknown function [Hibiscus syriacus]
MASNHEMVKVVGDRFCVPYTMELFVKQKIQWLSSSRYDVSDTTGNTLLRVHGGVWNLKRRRVMTDPAGSPVITLREKKPISWKQEWRIYDGESSDLNHFLFRVKRSSGFRINNLDVYLESRGEQGAGDFQVIGNITSLSFTVRRENSIIAEV